MAKWLYGDAWEHYPCEEGQLWGVVEKESYVMVHNAFDPLPEFMLEADMLFLDCPWDKGNLNTFYTKAGRQDKIQNFHSFLFAMFSRVLEINPPLIYLLAGVREHENVMSMLRELYPICQWWKIKYNGPHVCWLLRGSKIMPAEIDFTNLDQRHCLQYIADIENYNVIGDICMGQGDTAMAAYTAGKRFVGTELNRRRLANLLFKLSIQGESVTWIDKIGLKTPA